MMKRFTIYTILMLMLASVALAGNAPRIVQCGIDPVTVNPGQDFTLFADVADLDGLSDVSMVGLLSGDDFLMLVPKSEAVSGRFEVTYMMPETAGSGTYTLSMAAVDTENNVSDITYFTFKIADEGPVVDLISPDDGVLIDCQGLTIFEWAPFQGDIGGYAFALNLTEGVQVVVNVPADVTSLPIPGVLWSMMPDGDYFWQVGVLPKDGGEPYAWSELRSFTTECNNPWPGEVFGVVVEKDAALQTLLVRSNWDRGPNGVTVQVTENTVIWGAMGEIATFDDILVGKAIFAIGEFQQRIFIADEIFIEGHQPPPPGDEVFGHVLEVDLQEETILVHCQQPGYDVLIKVTEETVILGEYGPITLADILVEDFLNAFGDWDGDLFLATEIFVMSPHGPPGDYYYGVIDAIDQNAMTFDLLFDDHGAMDLITVHVTNETILESINGPIEFADLEVGFEADVSGMWEGDIFVAMYVLVFDGSQPPPPGQLAGTIVEVLAGDMQILVAPENWE
ncbi:DUF5666 domain-containing protein, partial [bacterium]|nr:DUF5666 domain-containing protein [bacterium]